MKLNNRLGLTLLEIVISMALSAVILVILFAAMRLGYKAQEKGAQKAEFAQKVRILNDRISWLLRGAYPFAIRRPDLQKFFFEGGEDRVGFVTTSVDTYGKGPEDTAGLKWVSLYADNEGLKIREKVFFLEDAFEDTGGKVYLLDPDVKKLEIQYYDIPEKGIDQEGEWVSAWDPDEKDYLPHAVRMKITLEHAGKNEVLPEMIIRLNVRNKLNP